MRYTIFSVALVCLQHLNVFQMSLILGIQGFYFIYYSIVMVMRRIFANKYNYIAFFIQEFSLTAFLVLTLLDEVNKFEGTSKYRIEVIQVVSILLAFGVEVFGLLLSCALTVWIVIKELRQRWVALKERRKKLRQVGGSEGKNQEDKDQVESEIKNFEVEVEDLQEEEIGSANLN